MPKIKMPENVTIGLKFDGEMVAELTFSSQQFDGLLDMIMQIVMGKISGLGVMGMPGPMPDAFNPFANPFQGSHPREACHCGCPETMGPICNGECH